MALLCAAGAGLAVTQVAMWTGAGTLAPAMRAVGVVAHTTIYVALLIVFGRTLLPGRVPLVTQMAMRADPAYHPGKAWYTRGATVAWCGVFAAALLGSAVLAASGAWAWWALWVGPFNFPLVIVAALAELAVRHVVFWGEPQVGLPGMIRAFRARGGR